MIRLEQIRTLEERAKKAVALIDELREENRSLKDKLGSYQDRISELEALIEDFKRDQGEIEQGIISAINQLDSLEGASQQPETSAETTESTDTQPQLGQTPVSPEEPESTSGSEEPAAETQDEEPSPGFQQVDQTPISPSPTTPDAEPEEEQTSELDIF